MTCNTSPDQDRVLLATWLAGWKDAEIETHEDRGDIYAVARKPD